MRESNDEDEQDSGVGIDEKPDQSTVLGIIGIPLPEAATQGASSEKGRKPS